MSAPEESREISPYRVLNGPLPDDFHRDSGGFAEQDHVDLRDYWRVFLKYRRIILSVFLVTLAATAVVTFTTDPLYTATATIQIERQAPKMAPVQEVQQIDAAGSFDKYDYYQTQFEILRSRTIAARVIKALGLEGDKRFAGEEGSPGFVASIVGAVRSVVSPGREAAESRLEELGVDPRLINQYLGMLSIDPVRNSRLVMVSFTSKFKSLSADVANKHIEEYTNATLEQHLGMTLKAKGFLESELAKAKERVVTSEAALNAFRKEKGVISLDGDKTDIVSDRLEDLNKRFTEAQADRIRLDGQYRLIKRRDYESLPDVVSSLLISQLKQDAAKAEAERAELVKKFKPGFPKMQEVMAREEQVQARLGAEIRKVVESIESAYLAAKNREEELGEQLEAQRQAALSQKDVGADYDTLKRDVDTARGLYANLLQRLKDVDVAEEIKVSNVSMVDQAAAPLFPSRPKKLLNLLMSSVVGLMAGLGLAFLLEYLDNTLKTPEDVELRLGLPTLGVIPSFEIPALAYGTYSYGYGHRRKRRSKTSVSEAPTSAPLPAVGLNDDTGAGRTADRKSTTTELVVQKYPRSVVSEAYRTIRTGVLLSSADNPPQIILVTSGASGEGKTVTAVNHALTLVQAGSRVLVIDADIRKPRIHRIFNIPNVQGLSTYLTGQSTIESIIREIRLDGHSSSRSGDGNGNGVDGGRLFVIPSGPFPPNPAELLGSRRMRETLEVLRGRYDYILIDSPPVLPVTDAVLLATMSDGVVLVVRGQQTPAEVAVKSRDRLAYGRAKILGVVLNDVDVTRGDYGHYLRYYYSYYAEAGASQGEA